MAAESEPEETSFTRRRHLVDVPLQLGIVWRSVALSMFVLLTVLAFVLLPALRSFEAAAPVADAGALWPHLLGRLWWIALVCIVLPALLALYGSHRIAGPLVRVKRVLLQLAHGQLPAPLRTRKRDWLKPEVALLNDAVAQLGENLQRMRAAHRHLEAKLAMVATSAAVQRDSQTRWQLQAAAAAADALGAMLQQFQPADAAIPAAIVTPVVSVPAPECRAVSTRC